MTKEKKYFSFAMLCVVAGGIIVAASLWAGWVLIAVGLVFGLIALFSKEKVPEIAVVATQVIAVENYDYQFQKSGEQITLMLNPEIHATPGVRVEDIQIEIKGKRYDTDWEPMREPISGDIGHYVYSKLPSSFKEGVYKARIIAIIGNKEYYSDNFDLEYRSKR